MFLRCLFLLISFLPLTPLLGAELNHSSNQNVKEFPPKIRILVDHNQNQIFLEATDKYKIIDPHLKESVTLWRLKGKNQVMQALRGGLKWGEEFPGIHQLTFIPGTSDTKFIVNGNSFSGTLSIYDIGGTISVVNELAIEDYLALLLKKQYAQPLAEEALAALVIAARTNAYYQVKHPKSNFWDIDGNVIGYKGITTEKPSTALQRALKKTRYMILSLNEHLPEEIKPFPAQWDAKTAKISISEANESAKNGDNAAVILKKAFPKASIQLIHFEDKP